MTASREPRLMVELPTHLQQEPPNNVAMYFKRFATVLLFAHPSISILTWNNPAQNMVTKAIDIAPHEESISWYFSGMVVQANRKKIKVLVKIRSDITFGMIKRNNRVWWWLTKNKVYVRTTNLTQSRHVNIGWMLYSHPDYINQATATKYLQIRIGMETVDYELVPHSITHMKTDGIQITTIALKVRAEYDLRQVVLTVYSLASKKGMRMRDWIACQLRKIGTHPI